MESLSSNILVVDDDADIREVLGIVSSPWGIGYQLLKLLKQDSNF